MFVGAYHFDSSGRYLCFLLIVRVWLLVTSINRLCGNTLLQNARFCVDLTLNDNHALAFTFRDNIY